jgi:hypothetical protein
MRDEVSENTKVERGSGRLREVRVVEVVEVSFLIFWQEPRTTFIALFKLLSTSLNLPQLL